MISNNSINVTLDGLNLGQGAEEWAGLRLMSHQVDLRNSSARLVFLDVPTGGGKTLACLLRVLEANSDAIFIYPTNELVVDQARQMAVALTRAGHAVEIIGGPDGVANDQNTPSQITLAVINRQSFENISPGRPHGVTLDRLLSAGTGRLILLTNPDTLFAMVQSRYARSGFLWKHLTRFRTLVIDEFHLYYGVSLAHLLYLLWCLRDCFNQMIFSSATSSDVRGFLSSCFGKADIVEAAFVAGGGKPARWLTELELAHSPEILGSDAHAEEEKQLLMAKALEFYEKHRFGTAPVKVLIIVNSVVFAEDLYRDLRAQVGIERISAIHGFVPTNQRHLREIVVGTSALEIGVDFDVASLIFEARDWSAFIQRLGRGGRHRPCEAFGIVPTGDYEALAKGIAQIEKPNGKVDYLQLLSLLRETLEPVPSHADFLTSPQGSQLLLAFIYQVIKGAEPGSRDVWSKIQREINGHFFIPPFKSDEQLRMEIQNLKPSLFKGLATSGFRGHILTLSAYFEEYGTKGEISVFDVWKLDFNLTGEIRPVLRVRGIAPKGHSWRLILSNPWSPHLALLHNDNFSVEATPGDARFEETVKQLLEGVPYYLSRKRPDWRLPAVKEAKSSKQVYLGAGALLAAYLERHSSQENKR